MTNDMQINTYKILHETPIKTHLQCQHYKSLGMTQPSSAVKRVSLPCPPGVNSPGLTSYVPHQIYCWWSIYIGIHARAENLI
jgi:hypothetical protein